MSTMSGTYRGTPKRAPPPYENSPSSIPRPKGEGSTTHSEMSGMSTLSASRQKQSKRDEVRLRGRHNVPNG